MSKPRNPCIRVASPDAVSDLGDWLASDDADRRLDGAKTARLMVLAGEIRPAQVLLLRRIGRICIGSLRPLSVSHTIGLPYAEFSGSSVHEVVDGLIRSLERDASARMSNK